MAPYHPPTGNRSDKIRLDFNENTVGCSPRVIEALRNGLSASGLTVYPDYTSVRRTLSGFFKVSPDELLLTNGTDEAIQVLVNTYVDDGDEVIALRPSYAMYRFYAEVAGAKVVEVDYIPPAVEFPLAALLAAITPRTRAVLVSNPNNPTGSSIHLDAVEQILKAAPDAAVLIDEAYFEFFGVTALGLIGRYPNLFVSRTFSKVYGMAAMRMGCLFSQADNVRFLHKAQSPYSVNMLAAMAAEAAVKDPDYIANYVTEALASRELLRGAFEKLGIGYAPSSANFILGYFGHRAIEVRDALREKAILVRDRSYEIPGGVRITAGTRDQANQVIHELEKMWDPPTPAASAQVIGDTRTPGRVCPGAKDLIVFDMDGVLIEVTESYRATIQATVKHFTGIEPTRIEIQDWKNRGGYNDDWKLSSHMIRDLGHDVPFETVVDYFQAIFHGNETTKGLIEREIWVAKQDLFERLAQTHRLAIFTGRLRWEANVSLNRFSPDVFDPVVGCDDVTFSKPNPEGLLKIRDSVEHGSIWYVGDTVDDARASKAAGVPFIGIAAKENPRYDELVQLLRSEGAIAILDDINSLEAVIATNR
ncbi:MAG: histidinol-phosphate aminotransferase [Bryobacterales bacterium]|nr:histidinol-phosphate aminotransferase [Bryobacterales bacterium]